MPDTPYRPIPFPRCLYAPDGSVVIVGSEAEEALYPDYAHAPAGPWPQAEDAAPAPDTAPAPEPDPTPPTRAPRKR